MSRTKLPHAVDVPATPAAPETRHQPWPISDVSVAVCDLPERLARLADLKLHGYLSVAAACQTRDSARAGVTGVLAADVGIGWILLQVRCSGLDTCGHSKYPEDEWSPNLAALMARVRTLPGQRDSPFRDEDRAMGTQMTSQRC